MKLFKTEHPWRIKARLTKTEKTVVGVIGLVVILVGWYLITQFGNVPEQILPKPLDVLGAYDGLINPEATRQKGLFTHIERSLVRNLLGYLEAIAVAIPLGFLIALKSPVRAVFEKYIQTTRFLPIAALIALFIMWFGIGETMKIQFLACGIFVYLLPATIARVDEVKGMYENTARTLNASEWEIFKTIYLPKGLGLVFTDIINLTAISWTYIIIAENVNSEQGGVGVLCWQMARQSEYASVFAVLFVILLIGFLQDKLLQFLDRMLFSWKYQNKMKK
ncbi:MAG: ABC transporter permease subunit [bacterium]|nr:ABC transporter permease subunit [bacterium]